MNDERRSRANHPTALRVETKTMGDGSEIRIVHHADGFTTGQVRAGSDQPWEHRWSEPPLFGADL